MWFLSCIVAFVVLLSEGRGKQGCLANVNWGGDGVLQIKGSNACLRLVQAFEDLH